MMSEFEKFEKFNELDDNVCGVCPAVGIQEVNVCVPVEIKPFAKVSKVKTQCVGRPVLHRGTKTCDGHCGETCKFTVSQKMKIEVPVVFGARTEVGEAAIDCGICPCGDDHEPDCGMQPFKCQKCG